MAGVVDHCKTSNAMSNHVLVDDRHRSVSIDGAPLNCAEGRGGTARLGGAVEVAAAHRAGQPIAGDEQEQMKFRTRSEDGACPGDREVERMTTRATQHVVPHSAGEIQRRRPCR